MQVIRTSRGTIVKPSRTGLYTLNDILTFEDGEIIFESCKKIIQESEGLVPMEEVQCLKDEVYHLERALDDKTADLNALDDRLYQIAGQRDRLARYLRDLLDRIDSGESIDRQTIDAMRDMVTTMLRDD